MDENSFRGTLTKLIKAMMDGLQGYVKILGELSDSFETRMELRQGDGLFFIVFNIALEGVMKRADFNMQGTTFNISG